MSSNDTIDGGPRMNDAAHGAGKAGNDSRQAALMDHEYDGIREYDNPTPGWWHALFLLSVGFSIAYVAWYHVSPMSYSIEEKWANQQVAEYARIFGEIGDLEGDEATILRMMADQRMMAIAQGTFVGNCAACHSKDGGGINGVNLTDDHYKVVKTLPDIFDVIANGAANGAMPPWKNLISQNERVILAAYVASLRSTSPARPRGPEGDVIPPWPTLSTGSPSSEPGAGG
ncbi:cbb3-type cytochrome c oxidase N-terminal domain-containing protein [Nodularia spumigena]|uniref:cbb3-type cytochrome c oxidase N-terminal domain-containing protein n=1 Tax=Nodularia spumigena TaxID=70799 RepID=UPI002B1FAF4D|nr:cbb3-type cytochrome c oxidase N-terminal domain-containing protein [Nodularia spumigena]MEA5556248.1 cbb3-type cytochrome c oxidase N-terminal domain-containing protein [Nodularia spumigena CH309]